MKLTPEQKKLFHECVDLALEVNNSTSVKCFIDFFSNKEQVVITVTNFEVSGFIERFKFINKELQRAKDYLAKLLECYG